MTALERPEGLAEAGSAMWERLTGRFEFSEAERPLLELVCRQADLVASLEAAVAAEGVTIAGSRGQPRLNAAVTELRQCRLALAKLLGELALPSEEDERPMTAAQRRAKHAAEARWARVRELRGDGSSASAG